MVRATASYLTFPKLFIHHIGSSGYKDSVKHFFESSAEVAEFAVQPGTVDDLAGIVCPTLL
jgi:hypothetical protein